MGAPATVDRAAAPGASVFSVADMPRPITKSSRAAICIPTARRGI